MANILSNMTVWGRIASIFKPQFRPPFVPSRFAGEPEQIRLEQPMRSYSRTRWLQSDVAHAQHMADQGDLLIVGQACESLMADGMFGGLMSTRSGGLLRLPRKFSGTEAVIADLENGDEGTGLFDKMHPPQELERFCSNGSTIGCAIGEYVPIPGIEHPIFVNLDPQFLKYRYSEDRWYYQSIAGLLPITPGDGRWVLHTPGGYINPWRHGLWRGAMRAYISKEHAFLYRDNYSGKLANAARAAYSSLGASEQHKEGLFQTILNWGPNTVIDMPPGWDVKLIESNGVGFEVFSKTIADSDQEFMIMVAGQVVTVTGGTGFANANVFATIRSDIIKKDGILLANTLNEQGLKPWVNKLYGRGACARVEWDTAPPVDLKARADAFTGASTAITSLNTSLAGYGLRVDARQIVSDFSIPVYPTDLTSIDGEGQTDDLSIQRLADKMTEHGIPRCEHGSSNRCRLCGVEREREPVVKGHDAIGLPIVEWRVVWRPIDKKEAAQ